MRFLIVIPAHNEEQNIQYCLQSLENQSYKDFKVIIVNDGSTDATEEKIKTFIAHKPHFSSIHLPASHHAPGEKVVETFNRGLQQADLHHFDVLCKFDADIVFPFHYLEELNRVYTENPNIGMLSGKVKITKNGAPYNQIFDFSNLNNLWQYENIASEKHIRGPVKSYRKTCFNAMGGLKPVLGWDNIDVMLAEIYGWETFVIPGLWVKHLRPTMEKYKHQKAQKLGEYFYNIGLSFPLAILSAAKAALKDRSLVEFWYILKTYTTQNRPLMLSKEQIKAIRKWRWQRILQSIRSLLQ